MIITSYSWKHNSVNSDLTDVSTSDVSTSGSFFEIK